MFNEEFRNEFLSCLLENAKGHNYSDSNYYELLSNSANMAGLSQINGCDTEFTKANHRELLLDILGEKEITYHIIHLYYYFSKGNPAFQNLMIEYLTDVTKVVQMS